MSHLRSLIRSHGSTSYYLIAELAYNHEGDIDYALRSIEALSAVAEVSAIKLHVLFNLEEYITQSHPDYALREQWLWDEEKCRKCVRKIIKSGKEVILLTDDCRSIQWALSEPEVAGIEIHAVCLSDFRMLEWAAKFSGPILLGVGGTELEEIDSAVSFLRSRGHHDLILMYGIQNYPTRLEDIILAKMDELKHRTGCEIGYADHTAWDHPETTLIPVLAYMKGIRIQEKHFTLDWGKKRIDYEASLSIDQLRELATRLELARSVFGNADAPLGTAHQRYGEMGKMKKIIVAARDLMAGERITESDLAFKRTGETGGISPLSFTRLLNKRVIGPIKKDSVVNQSKVTNEIRCQNELVSS